jgi:hypothetical protein
VQPRVTVGRPSRCLFGDMAGRKFAIGEIWSQMGLVESSLSWRLVKSDFIVPRALKTWLRVLVP